MQAFLKSVVEQLVSTHGNAISDVCIVIPNRRGALFIKQYLSEQIKQPIFLPQIYSVEDFIFKLSGYEKADKLYLLFELYEVYRKKMAADAETFDEFVKWAQILLQDFNEIDNYLADAESIYSNLAEIKYIENWSLNSPQLTDFQKQYLKFYGSLGGLYKGLGEQLKNKNKAYEGMAYRHVAENLIEKTGNLPYSKIIFAGFNALNTAEEKIIKHFNQLNKAELFWDADDYYLNNEKQEAGKFLRQWIPFFSDKKNQSSHVIKGNLLTDDKKIQIIGTSKNVGQTFVANQLLSGFSDFKNTALVLADENILIPTLYALPSSVTQANITMGYPLKTTPIASLINILFDLHENARKTKNTRKDNQLRFYHKDVIRLLRHPYFNAICKKHSAANHLANEIAKKNYIFIAAENLQTVAGDELFNSISFLFQQWQMPTDTVSCFETLISKFTSDQTSKVNDLETEFLFSFSKIITRIGSLINHYNCINELTTLRLFIKQLIATETISFYGEPLTGLQIMGILETRTLDFETIVLLSTNENLLPAAKTQSTFIPIDLKKYFGLPIHTDKDALYAYHFYRLIQRAKNIYLVYNTQADEMGKGERSRFIEQLIYELPLKNKNTIITQQIAVTSTDRNESSSTIIIQKDEVVLKKIINKFATGISPSALNTYVRCPLQFYYRYIEAIPEPECVEEDIGADVMGNAIHKTLEELYTPFVGKEIQAKDIEPMYSRVNDIAAKHFGKEFNSHEIKYGKNLLTFKSALRFIRNFLNYEKSYLTEEHQKNRTCTILHLEKKLNKTISIDGIEIILSGNADRIDIAGNTIRIIDYKTGKVEQRELKNIHINDIADSAKKAKAFQLLFYAYMFNDSNTKKTIEMYSGIISFRNLPAKFMPINESPITADILSAFEIALHNLLSEIKNTEFDFSQTDDLKICEYCSYKSICNR